MRHGVSIVGASLALGIAFLPLGGVAATATAPATVSATTIVTVPRHDARPAKVKVYTNCTALNKVYKHGVGRKGAHDHVSGKSKKVTNFKVSTALYDANKRMDRDKDGIACEKR